jgi:hypothetical protein
LHTFIHSICTIFTLPSLFPTSSPLPPVPNLPTEKPVLQFCKRKKMIFLFVEDSYTRSFLVTFPFIYVLFHFLFSSARI